VSNMCNFDQIRGTAKPLFVIFMFMRLFVVTPH
jgi:hypothetical protein